LTNLLTNLTIAKIGPESRILLQNLLQYYVHDMAQWFAVDTQPDGSYFYDTSLLWEKYDVYLVKAGDSIAGFAMVGLAADIAGSDMHEFFVIRRFRRTGIGAGMAEKLFALHPGEWLIRVLDDNAPAVPFWRATVAGYSSGAGTEELRIVNGRSWRYFRFRSLTGSLQ
jgi:predicted acetyltransferase